MVERQLALAAHPLLIERVVDDHSDDPIRELSPSAQRRRVSPAARSQPDLDGVRARQRRGEHHAAPLRPVDVAKDPAGTRVPSARSSHTTHGMPARAPRIGAAPPRSPTPAARARRGPLPRPGAPRPRPRRPGGGVRPARDRCRSRRARDGEQPRPQRAEVGVEAVRRVPGAKESLLHGLLRQAPVTQGAHRQSVEL